MWTLIGFNVAMVASAVALLTVIPRQRLSKALYWLHVSVGITAPNEQNARMVALIWIGTAVVMIDGLTVLLLWLT